MAISAGAVGSIAKCEYPTFAGVYPSETPLARTYRHLDLDQRRTLFRLVEAGRPVGEIAARLGRHPSTIYRELGRDRFRDGDRGFCGYFPLNAQEIGQSQMTKTDLLARPVRRHHVSDLDVTIGDDHAVDQELDQGPPLLEGGSVQALPHPSAELPDGVGQAGELLLPVRLRHEAPFHFLELPLAPFEVTPAPTVLVQRHHAGEVGVRQALELLPQAHLSTP